MKKLTLVVLILVLLVTLTVIAQDTSASPAVIELELVLDDFERGLLFRDDAFGNDIGHIPWGDTAENVTLAARLLVPYSRLAVPTSPTRANTVLAVTYDIGSWGGFTSVFNNGTDWIGMDWTAYNALTFWLYGNNTGGMIQVEIFDNRNPAQTGDTAERWYHRIADNYAGWQQFTIPFDLFQRRSDWQPNGALNDGLGLTDVSGYAFGFPAGVGLHTAYLDDVGLTTIEDVSVVTISGAEAAADEEGVFVLDESVTWDSRQWNLMWSDEFDAEAGAPINDEFWTCEVGGQGWGNNELQYYTQRPENVSHDGQGHLAIVAREENPDDYTCHYGICRYTSARCITRDKVEFTYGRVEARMRITYGQGVWPAFWMLGANFPSVGWPNSGEIDILENVGHEMRTVHGTVHGPGYSGAQGIGTHYVLPEAVSNDFHVFAIDWDPGVIRWYVDGVLFNTLTVNDVAPREWVFDHDFFLLMNVAVGGNWPGSPNATTEFPQTLLVDYVRVYQLAE